jgi:hypothetical protein
MVLDRPTFLTPETNKNGGAPMVFGTPFVLDRDRPNRGRL